MNKLYLILLPNGVNRDDVKNYLSSENIITFWFYNLPSSLFVRSNFNSKYIANAIVNKFNNDRILVVNLAKEMDFYGLIPKEHIPLFKDI